MKGYRAPNYTGRQINPVCQGKLVSSINSLLAYQRHNLLNFSRALIIAPTKRNSAVAKRYALTGPAQSPSGVRQQ